MFDASSLLLLYLYLVTERKRKEVLVKKRDVANLATSSCEGHCDILRHFDIFQSLSLQGAKTHNAAEFSLDYYPVYCFLLHHDDTIIINHHYYYYFNGVFL